MKYINSDSLIRQFLDLAVIDGTSLREKNVAAYLHKALTEYGIETIEQKIPVNGAETGNLFGIPPETDRDKPVTVLCAHMDTVRTTKDLKPEIRDEKICSDGSTILGADNRAGVAALLYMVRAVRENSLSTENIALLFTVAEEIGILGSRHVDFSIFPEVDSVFVFDCSRRPGIFIRHCYGCLKFSITVNGKSAHAGVAPEKGVNAIAIAARIISSVQQGRLVDDATLNIGTIKGGDATNIVSSSVVFEGEIRGPSMDVIDRRLEELKNNAGRIAEEAGGTAALESSLSFAPYYLEEDSKQFTRARLIIERAGLQPQPIRYTGGSDANAFNAMNIPSVNFGIGAQQPHSNDEFILIEDLVKTTELAFYAAGVANGTERR